MVIKKKVKGWKDENMILKMQNEKLTKENNMLKQMLKEVKKVLQDGEMHKLDGLETYYEIAATKGGNRCFRSKTMSLVHNIMRQSQNGVVKCNHMQPCLYG
ncbi:hypothetical protein ARMGADRAFT_1036685 [Armillaria gallica]|uniref:Uncharacterized protein n=1 Tax=Armillaria gallica TaxID=47427 RepID=A0A2H3CPH5_ARMGA|nr:hypothetical protein ARMGADRAFT_1036685 [Armillaria gallica]